MYQTPDHSVCPTACVWAGTATQDLCCRRDGWLGLQPPGTLRALERPARCEEHPREMLSLWHMSCLHRFDMKTSTVVWGSHSCSASISKHRWSPDKLPGFIKQEPCCTEPSLMPVCFQDFVYKIPHGELQDPLHPWARVLQPSRWPGWRVTGCKQQCQATTQDSNQPHLGEISKKREKGQNLREKKPVCVMVMLWNQSVTGGVAAGGSQCLSKILGTFFLCLMVLHGCCTKYSKEIWNEWHYF